MTKRSFKDNLYEQFSRIGKALSSPKRLEILDLLTQSPRTVESVAGEADLSVANASQHLLVLKAAGLLDSTKNGLHVTYRLADSSVASFLLAFRQLAEDRIADIERLSASFFEQSPEPMTLDELTRQMKRGNVVLLDVRPREEFEAGHLPGALSMPIEELTTGMRRLPKRKRVVVYCRGPYCVYAHDAVRQLRSRGYDADRIEEGVIEWTALGMPVESGRGGSR